MKETPDWYRLYNYGDLRKRRNKKSLQKYLRYGFPENIEGQVILDLCCGTGEFSRLLALLNPASRVLGVDIHLEVEVSPQTGNPVYLASDASHLPLADASVDQILCIHALHHLGDTDRWKPLVDELHRILRSGGRLHLVDHYPSLWLSFAIFLIRSPFSKLFGWLESLKHQLDQEEGILSHWLDNWKKFFFFLENANFRKACFSRKIFFFYAVFEKTAS